jgi:hypothetical protein
VARIAGHSNITITQSYVHPETKAVEAAFQKLVTYSVHSENTPTPGIDVNGVVGLAASEVQLVDLMGFEPTTS